MGRICGFAGHQGEIFSEENFRGFLLDCHRLAGAAGVKPDILSSGTVRLGCSGLGLGHQSPDGRYTCVVDGRLAEPVLLAAHLSARGFPVQGATAAEVLLSAFVHHGVLPFKHLRGGFALAIFDAAEGRLLLAADPYGLKRLYIGQTPRGLVFASDLAALMRTGLVARDLDQAGLVEYFSFGYISPPHTIYAEVTSLRIGEFLAWQNGTISRDHYHKVIPDRWEFADVSERSEDELLDRLDQLTIDAVKSRLAPGSGKIAAYLSSGLDTGLLAACLSRHGGREIAAFTLGSSHPRHDEVPGARRMAQHLGISDHRCVYLTEDDCFEALDLLPEIFGQPMADISAIPNHVITRQVGREFGEVFAGDGPDGLYGNWDLRPWHYYYRFVPFVFRNPVSVVLDALDRKLGLGLSTPSRHIGELLAQPEFSWVFHKKLKGRDLESLLGRKVPADTFEVARYLRDRTDIPLYERLRMAFAVYFVMHGVLLKSGAVHNANQVEQICPYYDRDLVDFICSLPTRYKTRGRGFGKYLHTRLLERYAPPEVWKGRKRGFIFDINQFDQRRLKDLTDRYLAQDRIADAGLLDPGFVRCAVDGYLGGIDRMGPAVMSLLIFELWRDKALP